MRSSPGSCDPTPALRPPVLFRRAAHQNRLGAMIEVQHGTIHEASELLKESAVLEQWAARWENGPKQNRPSDGGAKRRRMKPPELFRLAARRYHSGALVQIHQRRFREADELIEEGKVLVEWAERWERRRRWLVAAIFASILGIGASAWAAWPAPSPIREWMSVLADDEPLPVPLCPYPGLGDPIWMNCGTTLPIPIPPK